MKEALYTRTTVVQRSATVGDEWKALESKEFQTETETDRSRVAELRSALLERDDPMGAVVAALLDRLMVTEKVMFAHKKRFLELYDEMRDLREQLQVRWGPSGAPIPPMHYMHVWRAGVSYTPGDCVTHAGSMWHCGLPTTSKPGSDHSWQLTAKGGLSSGQARRAGL